MITSGWTNSAHVLSSWIIHINFLFLIATHHRSWRLRCWVLTLALLDLEPFLTRGLWELAKSTLTSGAILAHLSYSEISFHHEGSLVLVLSLKLTRCSNIFWIHVAKMMLLHSFHHHWCWLDLIERSSNWICSSSMHHHLRLHVIIHFRVFLVATSSLIHFPLLKYRSSWFIVANEVEILGDLNVLLF